MVSDDYVNHIYDLVIHTGGHLIFDYVEVFQRQNWTLTKIIKRK